MRRIKKIWEGEAFSTFSQCSPGETLLDLQGTQHNDQRKRLWPHDHHTHHTRTCKVLNTMIRKKDTDHMMMITALVWREWSKVEVPATPTSQTRCRVFLTSPKYSYLKLILVLQDFLMILTSPSLPSRTSGSPTDPSSAPPSLNPQTQLNWIRSDQLGYMNEVWPWSFLIIIVVENMFLEDDSSQLSAMPSSFSCYISNIIKLTTPLILLDMLFSTNLSTPWNHLSIQTF